MTRPDRLTRHGNRTLQGKRALVTGATGFLGSALCQALVQHGYHVRAMFRNSRKLSALENLDLEVMPGDVTDTGSLNRLVSGVDLVFHIAAMFRDASKGPREYRRVNVEGTKNVLAAAKEAGVRKVIHCSTVGVHGHIPNPPANESEAYRPGDHYQVSKCAGEKVAKNSFDGGLIDGCIIRPAMLWGPGDKRTLKLFRGIQKRQMPMIGDGKTLFHWVMAADVAKAFILAAEIPESSRQTYIIAGERPVTITELFALIANRLNTNVLPVRLPAAPLQLAGSLIEAICVPLGISPPIYRRRVDFFTKSRAFDCTKAKRELGYRPSHSIESEIDIIIASYRELGWLNQGDAYRSTQARRVLGHRARQRPPSGWN